MKTLLLLTILASFGGCANFTINGTICDQIKTEPNTQQIPQECRKYNEKEAEKAFFNKIDKKYSAKDEGMETMVPNKKDDPKDMKRKQTMTNQKATKVEMEPKVEYDK